MIRVGIAGFKGINQLREHYGLHMQYIDQRDEVLVAHKNNGHHVALMAVRPMIWVHDLIVNPNATHHLQARGAEALVNFTLGYGPAAPMLIRGGIFQTSTHNANMEAIAKSLDGVEIADSRTWRIDL